MKTNVIVFIADHFRADALHHLGNEAAYTPNLDKLVREDAVSYRNNFCQNPVCSPSRCSIMSGQYLHVHGHRTMHYLLGKEEHIFLRTMKQRGYHVLWSGKNDFASMEELKPEEICDEYVPWRPFIPGKEPQGPQGAMSALQLSGSPEENRHYYSFYDGISKQEQLDANGDCLWGSPGCGDLPVVDAAVSYLEEQRYQEQPFCMYISPFSPHPPYQAEPKWMEKIDRSKLPQRIQAPEMESGEAAIVGELRKRLQLDRLSEADWDDIRVCYLAMCARVDSWVGRIVDALKRTGQYENTVFVFMSDHGDFTGDYGMVEKTQNTFQDCLVNTPLIIKPAQGTYVVPGIRDALTENLDMVATIEELIGEKRSYNDNSKSLGKSLADPAEQHRDAVFCEGGRLREEYQASEYQSMPKETNHRYWPRISIQQEEGEEFFHGKAVMLRTKDYKYVCRLYEKDELYDLNADPMELDNIIDDPQRAGILMEMKSRLCSFFLETGDEVPISEEEERIRREREGR